jgi:hypothetical protein
MREARCRESERRELSWFFLSLFFPFFVYGPCFFGLANRDTRQGVGQSEDRFGGGGVRLGKIRGRAGWMVVAAQKGGEQNKVIEYNVTSNNVTRKHTNSTMQIIERKCKAKTGCWDKGLT